MSKNATKNKKNNNEYRKKEYSKKNNFEIKSYLWIIGLIIPIVGIVLYFVFKKKDKKESKKIITYSIVGLCIYAIGLIIFANRVGKYVQEPIVDNWYRDVTSGEKIVTIIGASYCSHCQEYKPVIEKLANKYKFKMYFFESDMLGADDLNKLEHTYQLEGFDGSVPFTFLVEDNRFITGKAGFASRELSIKYLTEIGVIKN